jgi:hypothetical protein
MSWWALAAAVITRDRLRIPAVTSFVIFAAAMIVAWVLALVAELVRRRIPKHRTTPTRSVTLSALSRALSSRLLPGIAQLRLLVGVCARAHRASGHLCPHLSERYRGARGPGGPALGAGARRAEHGDRAEPLRRSAIAALRRARRRGLPGRAPPAPRKWTGRLSAFGSVRSTPSSEVSGTTSGRMVVTSFATRAPTKKKGRLASGPLPTDVPLSVTARRWSWSHREQPSSGDG